VRRPILILAALLGVVAAHATLDATWESAVAKDTPESWDKSFEGRLKKAAKRWIGLAKWCDKKNIEWTAMSLRRRVFVYTPDDEKVREQLGYVRAPDGTWVWDEVQKDGILFGLVDEDDPIELKVQEKIEKETANCVKIFRAAARKAAKLSGEDPDNAGAWREREKTAWRWVLTADRGNQEAHKALGHPEFDGKFVSPYALPFLQNRKARKEAAAKVFAMTFPTEEVEVSGPFVKAGLTGAAVKSEHVLMQTVHGADFSKGMCLAAEKGLVDLIETYGFSENIKARATPKKISSVKDTEQYIKFLTVGCGWDEKKATTHSERYRGGTMVGGGERMGVCENQPTGDDRAMNVVASFTIRSAGFAECVADVGAGRINEPEDWLWQSMSYDMTKRILGTAYLVWAGDPKYGRKFVARPGQDVWIELARQNVEIGLDPAFGVFPGLEINEQEFKPEHTVKGHAVIQFVFEKDPAEAVKFIRHACAKGTFEAVKTVYGWTMEEFDQHWQQWILETHY
jgi:hypothetical protein